MTDKLTKFIFPRFRKAVLRHFSLFTRQNEISVEFNDGVFILAGANGLGKSTFLAALNYALTGIVPDPQRDFNSVDEYYRDSAKFPATYFRGRIAPKDAEGAEVELEFTVGEYRYKIVRGFFEPGELREFVFTNIGSEFQAHNPKDVRSAKDKHDEYKQKLFRECGLSSFEQLSFLNSFVFTFDERRHLLFWDQKVLEQVLFLAFGVSPSEAKKADVLRRESEKADSLARNANWQATEIRKKIEDLSNILNKKPVDIDTGEELGEKHKELIRSIRERESNINRIENELHDAKLKFTEASAEVAMLRAEYNDEYDNRIMQRVSVNMHPIVSLSLSSSKCEVCGSQSEQALAEIQKHIDSHRCPLCNSAVISSSQSESLMKLKALDEKLIKAKENLDTFPTTFNRLENEIKLEKNALLIERQKLEEFEKSNESLLTRIYASSSASEDSTEYILKTYRTQMNNFLDTKKKQYDIRNEKRKERNRLQDTLEQRYAEAESEFLPIFMNLAQSFLGIDLDIKLDTHSSTGLNLTLEVNSTARREDHQLSESQKFFVDIALRMALTRYMSIDQNGVCLLIDTPEGSLDIAYETRAGQMFADFAEDGRGIIMTANINSSQLLQRLAKKCGNRRLKLTRMTSWTQLSEVQQEEMNLFDQAYADIEKAMVTP